jgi:hypothetical protein
MIIGTEAAATSWLGFFGGGDYPVHVDGSMSASLAV